MVVRKVCVCLGVFCVFQADFRNRFFAFRCFYRIFKKLMCFFLGVFLKIFENWCFDFGVFSVTPMLSLVWGVHFLGVFYTIFRN